MNRRAWVRELAIAGLAGVVLAVSPLTPPALWVKALAGIGTAAAVLAWRTVLFKPSQAASDDDIDRPARATLLSFACAAVLLLAFAPSIEWMYGQWTRSVWVNSHGLFIPFVVAYMVWDILNRFRGARQDGHPVGVALVLTGLALAVLDSGSRTHYVGILGLFIAAPGFALAVLGTRRTYALRYAYLVAFLMIPVPWTLGTPLALRDITAVGVEHLLRLGGLTVFREGTILEMARNTFIVADACSGFSTLYASVAIALILALNSDVTWRRLSILGAALPLAIGANVVRVLLLVLITLGFGEDLLETPLHEGSGVATFFGVLLILFKIAGMPGKAAPSTAEPA